MVKKSITVQAVDDDDHLLQVSKKSCDKKNNLHSLIKVLRPKVYITDSSAFKYLVQELTGNGSTSTVSSPLIISKLIEDHEQVANNMMYNIEDSGFQESSPELSLNSSDHHFGLINSVPLVLDSSPDYMQTTSISGEHEFQSLEFDQMTSFPYEEMESWFLDMNSNSVYNNNYCYDSYALQPVMPLEACVFDYDLSVIM